MKYVLAALFVLSIFAVNTHAAQYEWWAKLNATTDLILNSTYGGQMNDTAVNVSSTLAGGYSKKILINGFSQSGGWDGDTALNPWWVTINSSAIDKGQICASSALIYDQSVVAQRQWVSGIQIYTSNGSFATNNNSVYNSSAPIPFGDVNRTFNFTYTCASTWRFVWPNSTDTNAPAIGQIALSNVSVPFQIGTNFLIMIGNLTNNTITHNYSYSLYVATNATSNITIKNNGVAIATCTLCHSLSTPATIGLGTNNYTAESFANSGTWDYYNMTNATFLYNVPYGNFSFTPAQNVTLYTSNATYNYSNINWLNLTLWDYPNGYMTIAWNNNTQSYTFYNDQSNIEQINLTVERTNLATIYIHVYGVNGNLPNTTATLYKAATNYTITGQAITDANGLASFLVDAYEPYTLVVRKDGYSPLYQQFLKQVNFGTTTQEYQLTAINTGTNANTMRSNCPPYVYTNTSCTFELVAKQPYNTLSFNYTSGSANGTTTATGSYLSIVLNITNPGQGIEITGMFINDSGMSELTQNYRVNNTNATGDVNIGFSGPGFDLMTYANSSPENFIFIYALFTIMALVFTKTIASGFYGEEDIILGILFGLFAFAGLVIFFVPLLVISLARGYKWFKNKA